ncbi:MAG: AAA family ATPase [Bacilli bacterium]|nr:AAA family ATPase [Bacilli bacterium]
MFLKRINAHGFKSFADNVSIEIKEGITGIVGPNGSGKSNVVDAIRWVLGEQSLKSLRGGDTMTDVIFNGSETRSAATRAMVSLTFDNQDHYLNSEFNEVEIKRILYKNGENEYYINNSKVRLKDITDLFIDTGAGNKSFNIVSQGTVGDIINNKPYERRMIFESAAGVLKYKKRKEDTLRKLDKTQDNLEKVNLLIDELEQRVEPLEKQSTIAKKYLEYKSELESNEISLIAKDLRELNKEYKELKENKENLSNDIEKINLSNSKDIASLEKLKLEKIRLDESFNLKNENLISLTKEIADLEAKKQLITERKKYEVEDLKLENNILNLKEEELTINKNITTLSDEIEKLNEELLKKSKIKKEIDDDILNITHKHYSLEASINTKNKTILEKKNRIDILETNLEENSSVPYPVKQILNNPRFTGVHGTISSLIELEDKYITAINVALGANSNVLVVDSENVAKESINYLKDNHLGRATFFPLNIIKERYVDADTLNTIKNIDGFIDIADKLVKYDSKYQGIIKNQLGNIIVVDDIDTLNKVGKLINYKYRIVSLTGEVLYVGGSITGGSIKGTTNILAIKEELSSLKKEMDSLNTEVKDLAKKFVELTSEENNKNEKSHSIQSEIINLREIIDRKNITLSDLKKQYNVKHEELLGTQNVKNNTLDNEMNLLLEEFYQKNTDKELLEKSIRTIKEKVNDISDEISSLENNNRQITLEYNKMQNELRETEVKLGKMDVKIDNYLLTLNEEYNMTYERALEIANLDIDINDTKILVSKLKKNIKELGDVNVSAIEEYEIVSQRYNFLTKQKEDITTSIDELSNLIKSMDEIMIDRFKNTFDEIQKEFREIYKELFKGGKGDLVLTEPENLLETGIEIVAIPPGKKLHIIQALSGGEKSLTAIALLFAILKIKPTPFVVLDEVEAALDEPNVLAFSKYLKKEQDKTQFIVITHKKKTMEYLDTLYGITMQESGVSKLVSVKLEDN